MGLTSCPATIFGRWSTQFTLQRDDLSNPGQKVRGSTPKRRPADLFAHLLVKMLVLAGKNLGHCHGYGH